MTSQFFINNRAKLKTLLKDQVLLIPSNGLIQQTEDTAYRFIQDNYFWYLTGLETANSILVLSSQEDFIILPASNDYLAIFEPSIDIKASQKISGLQTYYDYLKGWQELSTIIKSRSLVYMTLPEPVFADRYGIYTNPHRLNVMNKLQALNSALDIKDCKPLINQLRAVKQPLEIQEISAAIQLTLKSIDKLVNKIASFADARSLEVELDYLFSSKKAQQAFQPIIAIDDHVLILHNHANLGSLGSAKQLLFDIGAEVNHYKADISRYFCLSSDKKFSQRAQNVYEATKNVQLAAINLLKPGVLLQDYERQVRQLMAIELKHLGLITSTDIKSTLSFFPHATSHSLGLDAHDPIDYNQPIQENYVLTVEPGIYIKGEGIGVRLEDDVLVLKNGNLVLN